jgi:hypothetical protein
MRLLRAHPAAGRPGSRRPADQGGKPAPGNCSPATGRPSPSSPPPCWSRKPSPATRSAPSSKPPALRPFRPAHPRPSQPGTRPPPRLATSHDHELESIRRKARSCACGRISHVPVAAATRKAAGGPGPRTPRRPARAPSGAADLLRPDARHTARRARSDDRRHSTADPHRPPRPAGAAATRPGPSRSHHRPRPRRVRAAALSGRRAYRLPAALPL